MGRTGHYSPPGLLIRHIPENRRQRMARLRTFALAAIACIAAQAEACRFSDVDVYGLSDPVGAPAANVALSRRRAETVSRELAQLGYAEVTFKLIAAGESGAVMPTGEVEPLRRRVDIIFGPR